MYFRVRREIERMITDYTTILIVIKTNFKLTDIGRRWQSRESVVVMVFVDDGAVGEVEIMAFWDWIGIMLLC